MGSSGRKSVGESRKLVDSETVSREGFVKGAGVFLKPLYWSEAVKAVKTIELRLVVP